ncbi:MAG: sigma-E processing peptidase SpoIIGA [Clostridia bacterium]|nr:sigma-E processing peptidase SpoIIGA [Clostridia bacterium]
MVIYVDVLLFINLILDYLLLSLASRLTGCKISNIRKIISSLIASLFSLYIFLPDLKVYLELLLNIISALVTVFAAFGYKHPKRFLRCLFTFYSVTLLYGGLMSAIWMLFKPRGMSVNNGVVYFDISPVVLIAVSVGFYVVFVLVGKVTKKSAVSAKRCSVTLYFNGKTVVGTAMVDTGHGLSDVFGCSVMIIADRSIGSKLFGQQVDFIMKLECPSESDIAKRFRISMVKTVSGERLLGSVMIDQAEVYDNGRTFRLVKPIIVLTETKIDDECSLIIPPECLQI